MENDNELLFYGAIRIMYNTIERTSTSRNTSIKKGEYITKPKSKSNGAFGTLKLMKYFTKYRRMVYGSRST